MSKEPSLTTNSNIEAAALLLRDAGWIVLPPPSEEIPQPEVGQVWRSANPRIEPRTIVAIGPSRGWGDPRCIHFISRSRPPHEKWGPYAMNSGGWRKWVKTSGARPSGPNVKTVSSEAQATNFPGKLVIFTNQANPLCNVVRQIKESDVIGRTIAEDAAGDRSEVAKAKPSRSE